jgi:hypothetical protein
MTPTSPGPPPAGGPRVLRPTCWPSQTTQGSHADDQAPGEYLRREPAASSRSRDCCSRPRIRKSAASQPTPPLRDGSAHMTWGGRSSRRRARNRSRAGARSEPLGLLLFDRPQSRSSVESHPLPWGERQSAPLAERRVQAEPASILRLPGPVAASHQKRRPGMRRVRDRVRDGALARRRRSARSRRRR